MQLQQLDIFADSRDTMLRNDVAAALERRDAISADRHGTPSPKNSRTTKAWRRFPYWYMRLTIARLRRFPITSRVQQARRTLSEVIEPAARRIFGGVAGARWSAPLWGEMARRAAHLAMHPEHGDDHCAALWLRAGDWSAASDAVARIASCAGFRHRLPGWRRRITVCTILTARGPFSPNWPGCRPNASTS